MSAKADPTNPFHRASFWIEELKYGPGDRKVEVATFDNVVAQLEGLLREAGVDSLTGVEVLEACDFYGRSTAEAFGMPEVLARSVFLDGVMHGIAFAAGLEADAPEDDKPGVSGRG